jgi:hypothetical protein
MTLSHVFWKGLVATVFLTVAAAAPKAATLDFTDPDGAGGGAESGTFAGTTYELSATGGDITFNGAPVGSTCSVLVCGGDGLGVGDDEVSGLGVESGETLTIEFGSELTIDTIYLLDLFTSVDGTENEQAVILYDGGSVVVDADPDETPNGDSGFRIFTFDNPVKTGYLTFTAYSGGDVNDQLGVNDYAVAGISAVPLPAALPLFLTMLAGMGFLKWRRGRKQVV